MRTKPRSYVPVFENDNKKVTGGYNLFQID
jgi:hypothetical protein